MALKIWLPLNGNLNNLGTRRPTIALVGTPTVNNNGKIGQCYTFNGSNGISVAEQVLPSQTPEWSFACWFKLANTTSTAGAALFSERTGGNQYGYTIFLYPNNSKMLIDDGARWTVTPMTFSANVWYHLVITRSSTGKKLYVNGELKSSTTTVGNTSAVNANGCLVGLAQSGTSLTAGNQGFIGDLNDVRIYDHCLSALEVKEISQGLILHYKLNGFSGGVGENLLRGSASIGNTNALIPGWISNGSASNIEIIDNKIIHYKYNLNNTKYIPSIVSNVVAPLQWGKTYTYSMDLKLDKDITLGSSVPMHYWIGARTADDIWQININSHSIAGSTTISWVQNHTGTLLANTWVTIITKFTLPASAVESGYDYPGLRAFIYGSVLTAAYTGEVNVWMKNCKIELGDIATSWSPAPEEMGIDTTKIVDSSGYRNNGTLSGTATSSAHNDPRYGKSIFLDNGTTSTGSNYILTPSGSFNWYDFKQGTITGWICPTASKTSYSGSLGIAHDGGSNAMAWSISNYGNALTGQTANGNYVNNKSSGALPLNEWNFIAGTLDGTTEKLYLNGELVGTYNITWPSSPEVRTDYRFQCGVDLPGSNETFTGYYSDVRFYVTALSAEDIATLYHTSAQINNLGGVHGFEFIEAQANISVTENGRVLENEINEIDFANNAQFIKETHDIIGNNFIEK